MQSREREAVEGSSAFSNIILKYILYPAFNTELIGVRLAGGSWSTSGRLEVKRGGVWGTVCGEFFDNVAASIACYVLGLG